MRPLCIPNQEGASGFSWFSPPHTRHLPSTHPSLAFPHTPPIPPRETSTSSLPQPAGRQAPFRGLCNPPSVFPLQFGNEEQQLAWAKRESEKAEQERLARLRRQEQEDLELAIALSKADMPAA